MTRFAWFALFAALGLVLGGCGGEAEHEHEHGGGGAIDVPDHYADAVKRCEELSRKIDGLIADGHLDDVHPVAADIQKIAERLPALAKSDLPVEKLREVNLKSKELAGLFSEIDEAADAGKKEETLRIQTQMRNLISELKKHTGDEDDHEGH